MNKIKYTRTYLLLLLAFVLFIPGVFIHAETPETEEAEEVPVIFEMFVEKADWEKKTSDHITLDSKSDITKAFDNFSIENLKFEVTDENGVKKIVNAKYAEIPNRSAWFTIGNYKVGSKLKLRVVPESLPENYHVMEMIMGGNPIETITVEKKDPSKQEKYMMTIGEQKVAFLNEDGSVYKEEWINKDNTLNIPEGPEMENKIFKHWKFTRIRDGKEIIYKSGVVKNTSKDYFIGYEPVSSTNATRSYGYAVAKPDYVDAVKVNFYKQDGSLLAQQKIEKGKLATSVDGPTLDKHVFKGWADKQGMLFDFTKPINEDVNLYPKYEKLPEPTPEPTPTPEPQPQPTPTPQPEPSPEPKAEKVKITFKANEGKWSDGSTEDKVLAVDKGTVIDILKAPEREGYKFLYWKGSEYQPGDKYTAVEDHTFVAQWKKAAVVNPEPTPEEPSQSSKPTETSQVEKPTTSVSKPTENKVTKTGEASYITMTAGLISIAIAGILVVNRKRNEE